VTLVAHIANRKRMGISSCELSGVDQSPLLAHLPSCSNDEAHERI